VWKPLLHEIAAGSMDPDRHELDYLAQAHWHHFRFQLGRMTGLDRSRRVVVTAPTRDEGGNELIPEREIPYDTLVVAVGSSTNDVGTPGVIEHAISLDTADQAERFHRRLRGQPLKPYVYRDFGSLVSLGEYTTVGNLMGALLGGNLFVEGLFARLMYVSLYRQHLYALHGFAKVLFDTLSHLITRRTEPRVKLH
jgi:NADH dehydrogenase FAD-containing subunit